MYERGLSLEQIAEVCRVRTRAVRRVTEREDRKDEEEFFHRRFVVHDQPAVPRRRPLLTWEQRYGNLRWFVETVGRFPTQTGRAWERSCYNFLHLQRHKHHDGALTAEQVRLLDDLGYWYVPPREADHWQQRLEAYLRYMQDHGRPPRVESEKGSEERSLKIWVWSQRRRLAAGTMPAEQVAALDDTLPGWRGQASPVTC